MNGPRFFQLATRLPAYQGACRARAEAQAMEENRRHGGHSPRDTVQVGSGELRKIEGAGHGITENRGDGTPWISIEKATD